MSTATATPHVAAVILAAGGSTRFGEPKALLRWEQRSLITRIADTAWAAGLSPVIAVVGAQAERVAAELTGRPVQVLYNYRWQAGMSTSLAVGLAALPPQVEAAVFLPVDQPLISPALLHALIVRWQVEGAGIVAPTDAAGRRATPVLFAREFFPELAQLSGDVGGRALFARYADRLTSLPVAEADLLADVDTPEAFAQLQAHIQSEPPRARLARVRGILCDMDGVLWRGDQPLPGLHAFFAHVTRAGLPYRLVTNNSSRTPAQYVAKLAQMGVTCAPRHILNSALAAAEYLAGEFPPGARVYVIGGEGVRHALTERGFRVIEDESPADAVVVGWDRTVTWDKLAAATLHIHAGARFVSTNPDRTFPSERGLVPGNGAQVAAIAAATGVTPVTVGKPEPLLYRQALAQMGIAPGDALAIGDRLDTDILAGVRLGTQTALVLSGVTQPEDLPRSPIRPDLVYAHLADLLAAWQ